MALGQQQGRPVTPFEFTVTTVTGIVTALDIGSIADTHTGTWADGDYGPLATTGGNADLTVNVTVLSDAITVVTVAVGGTGYDVADTINIDPSLITGGTGGAFAIDVDTILGEGATATVSVGGTGFVTGDLASADELESDGSGTGMTGTVTASALNLDSPETGGVVSAFTVVAGGTGYVDSDAETLTYIGTGEVGISDNTQKYDHNQYELGGQVEEYKTGNGLTVTVAETGGVIDTVTVLVGGVDYRVGDVVEIGNNTNQASNGVAGTASVDTVDANGAVTGTLTVINAGTGYADGGENTAFVSRKLKTTATGEYAGANADNDPTVSVGRLPDGEQWIVQKRWIDGGTIEVYAEPTTVNSVGDIVGNVIRAEDITDEYRCVAVFLSDGVTSRFAWDVSATGDAAQAGYGFCREKSAAELAGDALVDADCPAGYVHSATNCVTVVYTTVNTDEGADTINAKEAYEQCFAAGNWYEPSEAKGSRCIEAVADNFSLDNFSYTTNSSAQDYAATVCQQMNFDWVKIDLNTAANNFSCFAKADVTTFVTQQTCADAGHVWVAGTCYNKADFGDGYSRQGNEGNTKNKLPK